MTYTSTGTDHAEEWRPIPGYEGSYEASSEGRIRSLDRVIFTERFPRGYHVNGRVLSPNVLSDGYAQVPLSKAGAHKDMKVHRAVAMAFLPNPENKPQVNHKNGKRHDNRVSNLEWVTVSENHRHAFDVLGKKASKAMLGRSSKSRKLTDEQIESILSDTRSQSAIARDYGVCQQTISNIKQGLYYRTPAGTGW